MSTIDRRSTLGVLMRARRTVTRARWVAATEGELELADDCEMICEELDRIIDSLVGASELPEALPPHCA